MPRCDGHALAGRLATSASVAPSLRRNYRLTFRPDFVACETWGEVKHNQIHGRKSGLIAQQDANRISA